MRKPLYLVLAVAIAITATVMATLAVASDNRLSSDIVKVAASQSGPAESVSAGLLVSLVPSSSTSENGTMVEDGEIFARVVDESGAVNIAKINDGVDAKLLSGGTAPILMVTKYDGTAALLAFDADTSEWRQRMTLPEAPVAICAQGDVVSYALSGAPDSVISRSLDTGAQSSFSLPSLAAPDVGTELVPMSRPYSTDETRPVTTYLAAIGDHVIAFSATRSAAQVTDVTTGQTEPLPPGVAASACAGRDGRIYAGVVGNQKGQPLELYGIDPESMKVVSTAQTDWIPNPPDEPPGLNRLQLLPTSEGVVLFASELPVYPQVKALARLWLWDGNGLRALGQENSDGIAAGPAEDGSVLVYGGSAQNTVTRVDLLTGGMSVAENLRSPSGSWVLIASE